MNNEQYFRQIFGFWPEELYMMPRDDFFKWLTADAPERKGKWITETKYHKDDEQEFYYLEVRCSECGAIRRVGWLNARYCPACGCEIEMID